MKKFLILLVFIFSSCSANFFSADLTGSGASKTFLAPQVSIEKTNVVMKLEPGVAFVSFPYLQDADSGLIASNPAITKVFQKDSVSSVNNTSSYFLYVKSATELTWKKGEESQYNSVLLNDGMNFVALYKGNDPLMLSEIKVNGQDLQTVLMEQKALIRGLYVFDTQRVFHNLAKEPFADFQISFGSGALIDINGFAKLSWPYSQAIQKQFDAASAADAKAQAKIQQTQAKEQEKYAKQIQKQFEKMNAEISQKIFKETQDLPKKFFQSLKGNLEEKNTIFADLQLLAQIHSSNEVYQYAEQIVPAFWETKREWQRPFTILSSKGLDDINSLNRSFVFVEFPYKQDEIDPKTGITSLFRGLAFVRAKDCSWKFDPIGTLKMEALLKPFDSTLYDEKKLVKTLEGLNIPLTENEDFTASRIACQPQVSSTLRTRGKLIDINEDTSQSVQSDVKLLQDHEKNCEKFGKLVSGLYPASLEEFVYHSEDEPKISGPAFPKISFDEDVCKQYWPKLLGHSALSAILNDSYTEKDGNISELDALKQYIIDDSMYVFLGTNKYFKCTDIEDATKKDSCLFGAAISKMATSSCKKIASSSVQAFCAGAIAQSKKSPAMCEKVYGVYDKKEEGAEEKLVKLRNCQLDALSVSAKTKSDCKPLKKTWFFFFHFSTPSSKACESYAKKEQKLAPYAPSLNHDQIIEMMGVSQ